MKQIFSILVVNKTKQEIMKERIKPTLFTKLAIIEMDDVTCILEANINNIEDQNEESKLIYKYCKEHDCILINIFTKSEVHVYNVIIPNIEYIANMMNANNGILY